VKRHELLAHLRAHGCELLREGSRHSIWWNPATGATAAVPRHVEVANVLARRICQDLGIPAPA
jgi:mRNA interferase HicA